MISPEAVLALQARGEAVFHEVLSEANERDSKTFTGFASGFAVPFAFVAAEGVGLRHGIAVDALEFRVGRVNGIAEAAITG